MQRIPAVPLAILGLSLALPLPGQTPASQSPSAQNTSETAAPQATFKAYTRMVTVDLVVKDSKGNHITGLTADDFQLSEQTPSESKDKRQQKIAGFREIHVRDLASAAAPAAHSEPGLYTNAVKVQQNPVPATILLVDGINTPIQAQMQIHPQMLKMLRQLPANVPVAVFLLGDRLRMLQGFTTDPRQLQQALSAAISNAGKGIADMNPTDDPDAAGNSLGGFDYLNDPILANMTALIRDFDQKVYALQMTARVNRTGEALINLSRNVAGFPGRKNLLWMSTAFPMSVDPFRGGPLAAQADYQGLLGKVNRALSDANVAVYPIDLGGVQTLKVYGADARPPDVSPTGISGAIQRNVEQIDSQRDVMEKVAEGTGGKVCTGSNHLDDCIRKAMDDSSEFYEISYYPNSPTWNGAYRQIFLKSRVHGAHLSYRNWYLATGEGNPDPRVQSAELQGDCSDYMNATAIPFTAKSLPADAPGQLKFGFFIDPSALAFSATGEGNRSATIELAVCTLNDKGWPLKIMNYPLNLNLNEQQYNSMVAAGGVTQAIIVPAPRPAAVRLLVKDVTTSKLGSLLIRTDNIAPATR